MLKNLNCSRGTTLVEVIAAIVILTMVTIAVITALSHGAFFGVVADDIYETSLFAQARIDEIRVSLRDIGGDDPFGELSARFSETDEEIDHNEDGTIDYIRTTEIFPDHDNFPYLARLKVTAYRADQGDKKGGPVIMETLLAHIPETGH